MNETSPSSEQRQQRIDRVKAQCEGIGSTDTEVLRMQVAARYPDGYKGPLFDHVNEAMAISKALANSKLEVLSSGTLQQLEDDINELKHRVEDVTQFQGSDVQKWQPRLLMLANILRDPRFWQDNNNEPVAAKLAGNVGFRLWTIVTLAHHGTLDMSKAFEQSATIANLQTKAKADQDEIEKTLDAVKGAQSRFTIAQNAEEFRKVAEDDRKAARDASIAAAGLGSLACGLAVGALFVAVPGDAIAAVSIGSVKLFVLSVVSFGLATSLRSYRASKHQQMLNRHRSQVLLSYDNLIAAATDEQTKNTLLREASLAIFSAGPTGYLGGKDIPPVQQLLEFGREIAKK